MEYEKENRARLFLEGQGLNLISLAVLFALMIPAWRHPLMDAGSLWGISTRQWFVLSIANAIAHPLWVWLWWRGELFYKFPSRVVGRYFFEIYATVFVVLLVLRPALATALSISNRGTVSILPAFSAGVSIALVLPLLYLGYSIHWHFGFTRAVGGDHFYESFRDKPLVSKGIFRYFRNPMYIFGLLVIWIPAIYFHSFAALISAMFCHAYIWVHYFGTERPDMRRIYGP